MITNDLEIVINQSKLDILRSGYTTIMDLAKLNKKSFFIPTPRQTEQEYLAKNLNNLHIAPYCKQRDFDIEKLNFLDHYTRLNSLNTTVNYKKLFHLFEGKGKLTTNT